MEKIVSQLPNFHYEQNNVLSCGGDWTILNLTADFELQIDDLRLSEIKIIDTEAINLLDSAGAELLIKLTTQHPNAQVKMSEETKQLLALISQYPKSATPPSLVKPNWLLMFGKHSFEAYQELLRYLSFIGEVSCCCGHWLLKPQRILWRNIIKVVESCGWYATGIIGLLSFLIGIVLTYQMGEQLKNYGADIFVVNLLGISILREFAPLITAIIISGRTGSAFTAELGTMNINQELNALTTMGVKPIEYLVLPKVIGLLIALPLLTMWASFTGLFGGMIMAKLLLGLTFHVFTDQFHTTVAIKQLWIGLMKVPVFAFIISTIGCFQGFQVKNGAESIGIQTTRSVVQSLFLIIVADAFFSIILSFFHA